MIGNSLNNHSVWSGLNVSGSETVKSQYTVAGTATEAKNNTLLPGNVVNNAKGPQAIGNVVIHNEHTVTDAVIGGNIVVNAGSTTGKISNDAEAANGYIKDRFDANKMQNNFNHQNDIAQNITTILTNIVNAVAPDKGQSQQTPPGQISDHDIGMMVSSGLGSIGGALFGKEMLVQRLPLLLLGIWPIFTCLILVKLSPIKSHPIKKILKILEI